MAKSFLGSFISATAKAADKAIKQAAKERAKQTKQVAKERERQAKIAEKERFCILNSNGKIGDYTVKVNGALYSGNLLERPVADNELRESNRRLAEAKAINRQWEQCFKHIGKLSAKGNSLEKSGKITLAIQAYEAAVEYGEITPELNFANYARDIDRLVILHRKQKDYQEEVAVLRRALLNDMLPNHRSGYEQRLRKAKELLTKKQ